MKFRNTVALAALFVALAGYLYFVENPRQREEEAGKKLLHFDVAKVTAVTLAYPDKQFELRKTDGGWRIEKPIAVDADQATVDNLVRAVADAEVKRTLDGVPKSLDTYGLDKPTVIVTLTLADGKTMPAIRVGAAAPVGFSAYVQLEGSPDVKLVPSVFQTGMKKELKDLRNKVVIDFKDDEVQHITVASGDSSVELDREGGEWTIVKPEKLKADPGEVRSFLSSLRGLRAQDFVDQPSALADYGLDSPREKIDVVVGQDKTKKELLVGAEKEKERNKELYVKRADGDTVYAVGSWAWTGLNKNVAAFRDKTVLPFDLDNLASVEVVRRDGDSYKVVRESASGTPAPTPAAATWKIEGGSSSKSALLGQLVGDLHGLKGYEIAAENPRDLGPFGLSSPDLTFSLIDKSGKPIGRILASKVGAEASANAYAMPEGGSTVFHLREYLYAHLDKKKSDFVETPPAPAPASPAAADPDAD